MGNANSSKSEEKGKPEYAEHDDFCNGRETHYIRSTSVLKPPFPKGMEVMVFGAGCFWGTEKTFWRLPNVYSTAVGYCNGSVDNPTYKAVCSGRTGHNEVTQVVWDPKKLSVVDLLKRFWECHDPTQGNGQGGDRGTQYRSGIYCSTKEQQVVAEASKIAYQKLLLRTITTEIVGPDEKGKFPKFWYAEKYHQQYLAIPGNRQYCSAQPTGKKLPPFSDWKSLINDESLREKSKPFLPEAFWKVYNGSVRSPNQPHSWNFGDTDAEKKAEVEVAKKDLEFAAMKAQVEKESDVVIHFCGGCGFLSQAEELKSYLEKVLPEGKNIGMLKDTGTTGNFDVYVRAEGTVNLVHSKKKDMGFVDTEEKKKRIVDASCR